MTNTEMLARTRVFLDEATAKFYSDANIYEALSQAQKEIGLVIAQHWFKNLRGDGKPLPVAIRPLTVLTTGTLTDDKDTIADIVIPIWFHTEALPTIYRHTYVEDDAIGEFILSSPIFDAGTTEHYYYIEGTTVYSVGSAGTSYRIKYIKRATDIDGSTQPILDEVAHDAIIERALWIMLADESPLGQTHLQLYQGLLQGLLQ